MDAYTDPAIQHWHFQTLTSMEEAAAWIAQWEQGWQAETAACWAVADGWHDVHLHARVRGDA
jgi:[ribosomal protein S5]-alanine N-acetyltransferase